MQAHEPYKLMSLRLSALPNRDRKWILEKLPPNCGKKLMGHLGFVSKFSRHTSRKLLRRLDINKDLKLVSIPKKEEPICLLSNELRRHLELKSKETTGMTEEVRAIVLNYMEAKNK